MTKTLLTVGQFIEMSNLKKYFAPKMYVGLWVEEESQQEQNNMPSALTSHSKHSKHQINGFHEYFTGILKIVCNYVERILFLCMNIDLKEFIYDT